jgi:hypothetical protein
MNKGHCVIYSFVDPLIKYQSIYVYVDEKATDGLVVIRPE